MLQARVATFAQSPRARIDWVVGIVRVLVDLMGLL
jgi:hypothetical protein